MKITVIVLQPLIATSSYKFKELEARFIRGQPSLVTLSENGLWLKDINQKDKCLIIYICLPVMINDCA